MSPSPSRVAPVDPVIVVPAELPFGRTGGPWVIRHCLDKLRVKYGDGNGRLYYSVEFDAYAAARAAADPGWRARIEAPDILATLLVASRYRMIDVDTIMGQATVIEAALRAVPHDVDLEQSLTDVVWEQLSELFASFATSGIAAAKVTKVLYMKRPRLIPMVDGFVMRFLFNGGWPRGEASTAGGILKAVRQFRALMLHGDNQASLRQLTAGINRWLADRPGARQRISLSPARVLDHLLWFDWNGYECLGWEWDKQRSVVQRRAALAIG
jgi:hypothetical protein